MPEPLLQINNLDVRFRSGVHAVRGVSYDVHEGEFLGIVGESGCGKSVSSMAIMGLLPSTAKVTGEVLYKGQQLLDYKDKSMSRLRGKDISMIFQDPLSALTPVYTIGDQISEVLLLHDPKLSKKAAWARSVELLKVVGIPSPERRAKAFPHEFSGGMRQRVMIAMAIANDPSLIIADEPTTALDVTIQAQILEVLQKAKELTGAAVILITHDLGVVAGNVDRVAVMYAGRIVESGTVDEVFYQPQMPYSIGLLRSVPNMLTIGKERLVPLEGRPPSLAALPQGCPFADRCPAAVDRCLEAEPDPIKASVATGHTVACWRADEIAGGELSAADIFPRPEPITEHPIRSDETILEVSGLKKHFPLTKGAVFKRRVGTIRAVDGISFSLNTGETVGLVGESGCGKTTTILEILEMKTPEAGEIVIAGKNVGTLSRKERRRLRRNVQIVFQDPMAAVDPRLPVGEIISEPMTVHKPLDENGNQLKGKALEEFRTDRIYELLELVGLDPEMADRYPHEFSGGQRQRIGIARALFTHPKMLVLDEPVSALDVSVQAGVINLLEDLRDQLGLSYLFVAHDLAVIRQISDKLAVMYLGRIIEYGPSDEVFNNPRHPYSYSLMSAVPVPDPKVERSRSRVLLDGDLPSPAEELTGCSFRGRCPLYKLLSESEQTRCDQEDPAPRNVGIVQVACHHAEQNDLLKKRADEISAFSNTEAKERR